MLSRLAKLKDVGKWLWGTPPKDGPRIVMSLDRSLYSLLGFSLYTYGRLIRRNGGRPLRITYRLDFSPENLDAMATDILDDAHGLLLTGGTDVDTRIFDLTEPDSALQIYPSRDHFEVALLKAAFAKGIPVLGICRGCQLINLFKGGSLYSLRDNKPQRRFHNRFSPHQVDIAPASKVADMLNTTHIKWVRSIHGMAVDRVAPGFRRIAWAPDNVTEGIESYGIEDRKHWVVGLQWHPELIFFRPQDRPIIRAFITQARAFMRTG
jgi:putative glutamine amidotransferase